MPFTSVSSLLNSNQGGWFGTTLKIVGIIGAVILFYFKGHDSVEPGWKAIKTFFGRPLRHRKDGAYEEVDGKIKILHDVSAKDLLRDNVTPFKKGEVKVYGSGLRWLIPFANKLIKCDTRKQREELPPQTYPLPPITGEPLIEGRYRTYRTKIHFHVSDVVAALINSAEYQGQMRDECEGHLQDLIMRGCIAPTELGPALTFEAQPGVLPYGVTLDKCIVIGTDAESTQLGANIVAGARAWLGPLYRTAGLPTAGSNGHGPRATYQQLGVAFQQAVSPP